MTRVAVFIDGFNLYHGMKAAHGRKYLWLDLQGFGLRLLRPAQELSSVTYFTARVRNDPDGETRQSTYLDALATHCPLVTTVAGRFQEKIRRCGVCGHQHAAYEEKETDVNIAVTLMAAAASDSFDTALLVSADSDLVPAVTEVLRAWPDKRVVGVFPPRRRSDHLKRVASGWLVVPESVLRRSQLPEVVVTAAGLKFRRPEHWS
ncbi:MAG TPA: NYN domain-containing protein [Pseudonocardiaceae bacterium]